MDLTGIGEFGKLGEDIVELVDNLLNDLEPIRTFNTMNKLTAKIRELCQQFPKLVPATVVEAFFGKLPAETKGALSTVVDEELGKIAAGTSSVEEIKTEEKKEVTAEPAEQIKEPAPVAQPANQNVTNNLKINTMNKLSQLQLNLATALATEALLVGSFIGKGEAFIKAFLDGFNGIADDAAITQEQLITESVTTVQTLAIICEKPGLAKMLGEGLIFYNDLVKNGKMTLMNFFHALIAVGPQVKQLEAQLKGKTVDPNLAADELALATDMGQLAKMYAVYFGGDVTKPFLDAITVAVSGGVPAGVTVKQLVDGGFAIVKACAALFTTNKIFGIVINAMESVYDDLAGFNVQQLWGKLRNFEKQLADAKSQVSGGAAILAMLNDTEKKQLSDLLANAEGLLAKILPADVSKSLTAAGTLMKAS